ncbi:MAG: heavy-metal-associated domain-containing protein [Polynucleobacter sp.]|uniref:heavy-metal-associated domain-containing protein n=1 Tax=Polynucleobacter sp. TaxID=2029855 RepID=UPI00271AA265|nr:heavy-metal-associated domain-containing protein [Polynucleobacter sp.]MDO8713360.1 heavy-metal-associated domain-containing protein [Polynucleobacter sp.]
MSQINLNVAGMTCGSCVKHVTKALESLDGVSNIHVDLQNGKVHLDRTSWKSDDLIHTLNEDGYPSSLDLDGSVQAPQKKSGGCCCG